VKQDKLNNPGPCTGLLCNQQNNRNMSEIAYTELSSKHHHHHHVLSAMEEPNQTGYLLNELYT